MQNLPVFFALGATSHIFTYQDISRIRKQWIRAGLSNCGCLRTWTDRPAHVAVATLKSCAVRTQNCTCDILWAWWGAALQIPKTSFSYGEQGCQPKAILGSPSSMFKALQGPIMANGLLDARCIIPGSLLLYTIFIYVLDALLGCCREK